MQNKPSFYKRLYLQPGRLNASNLGQNETILRESRGECTYYPNDVIIKYTAPVRALRDSSHCGVGNRSQSSINIMFFNIAVTDVYICIRAIYGDTYIGFTTTWYMHSAHTVST